MANLMRAGSAEASRLRAALEGECGVRSTVALALACWAGKDALSIMASKAAAGNTLDGHQGRARLADVMAGITPMPGRVMDGPPPSRQLGGAPRPTVLIKK